MIIKNGCVVIDNKLVRKDILVQDDLIVAVEDFIDGEEYLDAKGCLIMPGATDVHVHLREPGYEYKETILSGSKAAAKGGVTTVFSMPNLNPVPDCLESLNIQKDIIKRDAVVNILPYGSVTKNQKGQEIANFEELYKEVVAFTDDGCGVNNIDVLKKAMEFAKDKNIVLASHAEDSVDGKLPQGEYVAVEREIKLAKEIGCKYHFLHMSTKQSFELIRKAHKEGYTNITCEVSPHHLLLNSDMIKNGNYKMNPPLRSKEDQQETIKALIDGVAVMIASDHAPHSEEEKNREYDKCLNGIIGIETMLPLIYTNFIKTKKASLQNFIDWFVTNPRKVFSLEERKIEVGYKADITVLDIEKTRVYQKEEILSLSKNSPYIGMSLTGFPRYTIVAGKVVYSAN